MYYNILQTGIGLSDEGTTPFASCCKACTYNCCQTKDLPNRCLATILGRNFRKCMCDVSVVGNESYYSDYSRWEQPIDGCITADKHWLLGIGVQRVDPVKGDSDRV